MKNITYIMNVRPEVKVDWQYCVITLISVNFPAIEVKSDLEPIQGKWAATIHADGMEKGREGGGGK